MAINRFGLPFLNHFHQRNDLDGCRCFLACSTVANPVSQNFTLQTYLNQTIFAVN